jgi:hypothetical protein
MDMVAFRCQDSGILNLGAEPFQSMLPGCGMPYTVMSKTIPQTQHSGDNSKRNFSENTTDRKGAFEQDSFG